jgi:hypothetical protein
MDFGILPWYNSSFIHEINTRLNTTVARESVEIFETNTFRENHGEVTTRLVVHTIADLGETQRLGVTTREPVLQATDEPRQAGAQSILKSSTWFSFRVIDIFSCIITG